MRSLKVLLLPFWPNNPYHKLLTKHLEGLGVQVKHSKDSNIFITPAIMRWRPNVLHFHSLYPFFLSSNALTFLLKFLMFFSQVLILKLMGVKIIWTVHDLKNHENLQLKSEQIFSIFFAKFAYAIITHCEIAKQQVINSFHVNNKYKIFVIPHGNYIDYYDNKIERIKARKILGISDTSLILLFLGLIRPYKGVPELIYSFKQLQQDDVHLVIVGKPLTNEIAEQVKQMTDGHANIKFLPGFVTDDQIQVYMNACDVVVLPYRDILTSGSIILAMSFGRACIAPCKGCIKEVLDNLGAFLYHPDDECGLLKAMDHAVKKKAELLRMGEHNRHIVEQYSWNRIAQMTLKVYQPF